jgi:hypothetical protein
MMEIIITVCSFHDIFCISFVWLGIFLKLIVFPIRNCDGCLYEIKVLGLCYREIEYDFFGLFGKY